MNHSTQTFHCIACSSFQSKIVYTDCKDTYLGKPYVTDYNRCTDCNLVQQSRMPLDVRAFYNDYPIHGKKSLLHQLMRRIVMAPVYWNPSQLKPDTTLLDYGCGDGWFLESLKTFPVKRLGFEANSSHAIHLSQELSLPVLSDETELLNRYAGTIDVITLHFVLEHLPDLHKTFTLLQKLLKPRGTLYIVVPHFDSLESKLFRKNWHNLDAPRHLSFPDKHTTELLAQAHGFALIQQKALPFPNGFAGSIPVLLTGRFHTLLFLLFLPLGILFSRIFRDGTQGYWLESNSKPFQKGNL